MKLVLCNRYVILILRIHKDNSEEFTTKTEA